MTKKPNKNLSFIDPSCLEIHGLKQVAALETLGTFIDYLDPILNQSIFYSSLIENYIISIKNSISNHPYDKLIQIIVEAKCKEIDVLISPFLNINESYTYQYWIW